MTHHLTLSIPEGEWICSCNDWMYRPKHERYSQEKLKAAHKRHTARYNNRKDWRVPEVGTHIRCEHCNKLIIKNRRSHRFCSRKCAALQRYTK